MEDAALEPLGMHEHSTAAPVPWALLQDVLSFKIRDLRAAAELQACSREPVVWHPLTQPSFNVQQSCFSLLSKHDAAGRPAGNKAVIAAARNEMQQWQESNGWIPKGCYP